MRQCYDAMMRTTLDIDDHALSAARALAAADGISIGRAVSRLVERGLRPAERPAETRNGFPVIAGSGERVITDEMVADHRDD